MVKTIINRIKKLGGVMSQVLLGLSIIMGLTEVQAMNYKETFKAVAEEKDGYQFGEIWRLEEGSTFAVLPITRDKERHRTYRLACESDKIIITDTGQINRMTANNNDNVPILIRAGEIFKGKTQTRAAQRSTVIMPGEEKTFEVVCIYASKGIAGATIVDTGGDAVPLDIQENFRTSYYHSSNVNQHKTWNDVQSYNADASINTNAFYSLNTSDNLEGVMEDVANNLKDILEKVPSVKNQVGVVLIDTGGVKMIDCFDLKKSWDAIKEEHKKQYGEKLTAKKDDGTFTFNPDKAKDQVKTVLTSTFEEKPYEGQTEYQIIGISSGNYVGEVVELNGEVVHFNITRRK